MAGLDGCRACRILETGAKERKDWLPFLHFLLAAKSAHLAQFSYKVANCRNYKPSQFDIMAKVTGPLHSDTASGTHAKILTFSKWKGVAYSRVRVIPKNPKSDDQKTVRSALGTIAKACAAVLTYSMDTATPKVGSPFFTAGNVAAPSGQSWISYLQKILNSQFAALVTAYGVLSSTIKGYYNTSAEAAGLASYTDKSGVTHTAGEQLYLLANYAVQQLGYTGFASGVDSATSDECNTFEAYVHETTP